MNEGKNGMISEIFDKVPADSQICGIQTDYDVAEFLVELLSKEKMNFAIELEGGKFDADMVGDLLFGLSNYHENKAQNQNLDAGREM